MDNKIKRETKSVDNNISCFRKIYKSFGVLIYCVFFYLIFLLAIVSKARPLRY